MIHVLTSLCVFYLIDEMFEGECELTSILITLEYVAQLCYFLVRYGRCIVQNTRY